MKKNIFLTCFVIALAGCGGDSDSSGSGDILPTTELRDRLLTGRGIISTNDWLCEFLGEDGNAQFTDDYGFFPDGLGLAKDGFIDYIVASGNSVTVTKQVKNHRYIISNIAFTSVNFDNDQMTANLNGEYIGDNTDDSYPLRCTRQGPAQF